MEIQTDLSKPQSGATLTPLPCSANGTQWQIEHTLSEYRRVVNFLAEHHCQAGPAIRIRDRDYICEVRVNTKNGSYDYRGEGFTAGLAMLFALLSAADHWPNAAR